MFRSDFRFGLSTVEFLGCLVAVAGGVWIGANYVGLNLEGVAYTALDESELLTQIPEDWRPVNPDCPDGDCPDPEQVRLMERAKLQSELEELRFEVAKFTGTPPDARAGTQLSPEDQTTRDRTHAAWLELSEIVTEVTTLQHRVSPYVGTEHHSQALAVRRRALEYGQHAANLLNLEGVDPEATATVARVGEWLGHAAETLQTAVTLKGLQAVDGRAVPAAEVWAQTESELQKRTDLVRRKSAETSTYLTTRYFVEFPPLGI